MNKKGFTLVELLGVIVIIGILGMIATFSYTSLMEKSKTRSFELYEETMYSSAMTLLTTNTSLIPSNGQTKKFTLSELNIEKFNNPRNKNDLCPNSYVDVIRNDYINTDSSTGKTTHVDAFTYKVCLICENSDYNVDGTSCTTFPKPANR